MQPALSSNHPTTLKFEQIMHPDHCLCKDDIVWLLEFIKKRVADEDPNLLELTQPRLLKNFHYFAEVAMLLIHSRRYNDQEMDRLRDWMKEASYGLYPSNEITKAAPKADSDFGAAPRK